MRAVALLTRQWPQTTHQELAAVAETRLLMPEAVLDDFFRTFNEDVTVLCSSFLDPVEEALLEALPGLALVAHTGAWTQPREPLEQRGIGLIDSGAAGASAAAEFAVTQLLSLARRSHEPLTATGRTRTLDQELGSDLYGKRVLLLGQDAIADHLAALLTAWNLEVTKPGPGQSIEDALARADVISLHGPATFLRAEHLAVCRSGALILDIGLVPRIESKALIGALREYRIGGAALDAVSDGTDATDFKDCPNLLLTPQLATNTLAARLAMTRGLVPEIAEIAG